MNKRNEDYYSVNMIGALIDTYPFSDILWHFFKPYSTAVRVERRGVHFMTLAYLRTGVTVTCQHACRWQDEHNNLDVHDRHVWRQTSWSATGERSVRKRQMTDYVIFLNSLPGKWDFMACRAPASDIKTESTRDYGLVSLYTRKIRTALSDLALFIVGCVCRIIIVPKIPNY